MARIQSAVSAWGIDSSSGVTATFGSTPTVGNRLIATVTTLDPIYNFNISGSGWELIGIQRGATRSAEFKSEVYVWTKVAGESEPTAITVTPDQEGWTGSGILLIEEFPATGRLISGHVNVNNTPTTATITDQQLLSIASPVSLDRVGLAWVYRAVRMTAGDPTESPSSDVAWTPTGGIGDLVSYHPGDAVPARALFAAGYEENPGPGVLSYGLEFSATTEEHGGGPMFLFAFEPAEYVGWGGGHLTSAHFYPASTKVLYGALRGSSAGGNTFTMPKHEIGDLIVAVAYRDRSTTPPTLPAGLGWVGVTPAPFGSSQSMRVAFKIAASTSETAGTFTNATTTIGMVFKAGTFGLRDKVTKPVGGGVSSTSGTSIPLNMPDAELNLLSMRTFHAVGLRVASVPLASLTALPDGFVGGGANTDGTDSLLIALSLPSRISSRSDTTMPASYSGGYSSHPYILHPPADTVDLTAEGTDDWAYFGHSSFFRVNKLGGAGIGTVSVLPGTASGASFSGASAPHPYRTWSDGDEVESDTDNEDIGYFSTNAIDEGFTVDIDADTTLKRVRVYMGVYQAPVTITATLSDNSAPPVTRNLVGNGEGVDLGYFEFDFAAASAGQTLTIEAKTTASVSSANIAIHAITLATLAEEDPGGGGGDPPPARARRAVIIIG